MFVSVFSWVVFVSVFSWCSYWQNNFIITFWWMDPHFWKIGFDGEGKWGMGVERGLMHPIDRLFMKEVGLSLSLSSLSLFISLSLSLSLSLLSLSLSLPPSLSFSLFPLSLSAPPTPPQICLTFSWPKYNASTMNCLLVFAFAFSSSTLRPYKKKFFIFSFIAGIIAVVKGS